MLTVETFETLGEAARALSSTSRYLGGGTLLMRAVNYGDQSFDRIVRARDRGLRTIRNEGSRITIGSGVTMADIIASRDTDFLAPVARSIGGPAVRNAATVGGNLFAHHPYGDFTAALLALDAVVRMDSGSETPIESFLANRDRPSGLVAAISLAKPNGDDFRYRKVSRVKPKGVSLLTIAAWLPRSGSRLNNVRVAYSSMGPTPVRAKAVERALEGQSLDAVGIARALEVATEGLSPPTDELASEWYRREVAPVHLKRLLLDGGRG